MGGSLLAALWLRLWGLGFAPTEPAARPDEDIFILRAFDIYSGDQGLPIVRSGFPEGYFRLVHLMQVLETWFLERVWGHPVHLACVYAVNPLAVEILPRLFSVLADVAACAIVGLTVRRLARGVERDVALPAGILALGCNYLALRNAHFAVTDAPLELAYGLCLYALVRAVMDGPRFLPLAAAAAGAGFGIKYAAVPLLAPCVVAFGCCLGRFPARLRTVGWGVFALASATLAFQLTSPSALTNFHELTGALLGHGDRYGGLARAYLLDQDWVTPPGWRFYLFTDLPIAFGWTGLLLAAIGLALCFRRDVSVGAVLVASVLAALAILARIEAQFVRYAAPLLPPLVIGLGFLVSLAYGWGKRRLSGVYRSLAFAALLLLAFAAPLREAVAFDRLLEAPDTRELVKAWLEQHGSTAAVTLGTNTHVHLLDPSMVSACRPLVPPFLWNELPRLPPSERDWNVFVGAGKGFWGAVAHNANENCIYASPSRDAAQFVVAGHGVLSCGKLSGSGDITPLDAPCFQLAAVISPGVPTCEGYFDLFDSMWIPYSGFEGWQHAGPRFEIYENRCRKD